MQILKNKYFFNKKSPSYILIPEKDDFSKENFLVLPDSLRNKCCVKGKSPQNV
jgi:hypothetical protein